MFKVSKKDNSLEDFDSNKIIRAVQKAGGSEDEAEEIATLVETWLLKAAANEIIQYDDLKSKVLELLRSKNPSIAQNFEDYRKKINVQPVP